MPSAHFHAHVKKNRPPMTGLRRESIWAPDTGRLAFAERWHRSPRLAADNTDTDLWQYMNDALVNVDGWVE